MLDELCLDIIQVAVELQGFTASSFGTIALHVPHGQWDALLATPDRFASLFLEVPLSMHFIALILHNCSLKSTIFRNFARWNHKEEE